MLLTAPAQSLLTEFIARRPLRGGSLILTVFGDSLACRGGAITLGSLISLLAPFGLTDRLVRTSVGRLAAEGWLEPRRVGRLSEYRLSTSGRARFAEATRRIYGGPPRAGNQTWTMVVLPPPAADRSALRDLLRLEGFGELDGATHVHPTVTAAETRAYLAGHGVHHALIFESTLVAGTDAAGLIARGWNLSELGDRYRRFQLNYAAVDRALATGGPTTALEAFVIRTLLIHDYRRIHLRDPELPTALLPPDWEGHLAYARCRTIYPYVWAGSEQHLDAIARRLDGPLPVADASSLNRFPAL